jgi:enoyl-[acyl-carrier protein] reductase I
MGFLQGKRALIIGLASPRSIAYGIAEAMAAQGAELAFNYQNERLGSKVRKIAEKWAEGRIFPCDVSSDAEITELFVALKKHWDTFDILVHAVAYAPQSQLQGRYIDNVTREGFAMAHDISSYSLAALIRESLPMLNTGAAIAALTYIGSTRTIPCYNTMGVAKASLEANVRYLASSLGPDGLRVNAISAGPIRTLASAGIKDFKSMLDYNEKFVPMRKNVTIEQVGQATAFICSPLASGITGEVIHVDHGFHMVGMTEGMQLEQSSAQSTEETC